MYRIERYLPEDPMAFEDDFLEVSESRLELTALPGEMPAGEVKVRSRSGREVHVFFYSDHYRMQCRIRELVGKEGILSYRFDTTGMEAGVTEKGELCILSEMGEHRIPFVVSVRQPLAETSLGEIRNLFHFANLARENWEEAVKLFYSKEFAMLFYGHDRRYYDLYRGLATRDGNEHNVDEFLTGIHKKQKNTYTACEEGLLLQDVKDGQQEHISIRCNGWGYMYLEIETKGEFLSPLQSFVTNADFDENCCEIGFEIHTSWLKPGSNIGAIVMRYEGGRTEVPIIVETPSKVSWKKEEAREVRKLSAQLMRDYIAYTVLQGESRQNCLAEAEKTAEKINSGHSRSLFGRLCQMHILLEMGRSGEAAWVLSHIEKTQRTEEMEPAAYGFYLYLKSVLDGSDRFLRSAGEEVARTFEQHPEDAFLACLYVRMHGDKLSVQQKLAIYEEQYVLGSRSPILYLETLAVYGESLAYLAKTDDFEIAVLSFAIRYGMYTAEMAQRVTEIAIRKKTMSEALFRFLRCSYEAYPEEEALNVLCTLMIRTGLSGRKCFVWYERAVQNQLRITSLYEYYMLSADTREDKLPPRAILMYFAYHCDLDERRKAYLFALLVRHRQEIPELFRQYEKAIEEFSLTSMAKGVISENLAVLYRYVLGREDSKVPQDNIQKIAFRHLIKVYREDAVNVVVLQDKLRDETVYPIEKMRAYIDVFTPDYVVLLEDALGNRYCNEEAWTDSKLMAVEKLSMYLEERDDNSIGFLMYRTHIAGMPEQAGEELWPLYRKLILSCEIEEAYRREIAGKLLSLYFDREQFEQMDDLLAAYELSGATETERAEVIRYLIYMEKDEEALAILYNYGFEHVSARPLTRLIGRMLQMGQEFDHKHMALIYHTFCLGKYTQEMLVYLCRYFEGTLKQMKEIWKACVNFEVEASAIAERILQSYLFSHGYLAGIAEVFAYYVTHRRRESVVKCYIYDMTYRYFVKQQLSQPYVFEVLEEMLLDGYEMATESIVAYLYYMATEVSEYGEKQKTLIAELVNHVISEKQYVPFFSAFVGFIPWLRPYAELTYLVYRTKPGTVVTLHYLKDEEDGRYCRIKLEEVCGGYYCHNFVLFFGERLQYYFMEQQGNEQVLTESGCIEKSDMTGEEAESRYGLLNDIIMSEAMGDERTKRELIRTYEKKSLLTEALFGDC